MSLQGDVRAIFPMVWGEVLAPKNGEVLAASVGPEGQTGPPGKEEGQPEGESDQLDSAGSPATLQRHQIRTSAFPAVKWGCLQSPRAVKSFESSRHQRRPWGEVGGVGAALLPSWGMQGSHAHLQKQESWSGALSRATRPECSPPLGGGGAACPQVGSAEGSDSLPLSPGTLQS